MPTLPSSPKRVQMTRQRPWRADNPDAVIVARPSRWGNPFPIDKFGREKAIELYRNLVSGMWNPTLLDYLSDEEYGHWWRVRADWNKRIIGHPSEEARSVLKGLDLACWCPLDQPCHADVLLELANGDR